MDRRLRIFLVASLLAFVAAFLVQTVFQSLGAERSYWGGNPGWQREIAIWNVAAAVIALRALQLDRDPFGLAVAQGFTVLFLMLCVNHVHAWIAMPAAQFHWPPMILNALGFAFGLRVLLGARAAHARRFRSSPPM